MVDGKLAPKGVSYTHNAGNNLTLAKPNEEKHVHTYHYHNHVVTGINNLWYLNINGLDSPVKRLILTEWMQQPFTLLHSRNTG